MCITDERSICDAYSCAHATLNPIGIGLAAPTLLERVCLRCTLAWHVNTLYQHPGCRPCTTCSMNLWENVPTQKSIPFLAWGFRTTEVKKFSALRITFHSWTAFGVVSVYANRPRILWLITRVISLRVSNVAQSPTASSSATTTTNQVD